MNLPYFYEPNIILIQERVLLSESTSKHCITVLRMSVGDCLQLTNGKGQLSTACIVTANKKQCVVTILSHQHIPANLKKVSLGVSLLKNIARFEWMLEKVVEIGVNEVIPVICGRTIRAHFNVTRMENIIVAAMLQSKQVWLPTLQKITTVKDLITTTKQDCKLIAHCNNANKKMLTSYHNMSDVQILIGPEGDFLPEEIETALKHNYEPVTLGNTRLRTETAAIVAATLLV